MPLTVTFRCPQSHVRLAQRFVPDFRWMDGAQEGTVVRTDLEEMQANLQAGDLVISRTNKTAIKAALRRIAWDSRLLSRVARWVIS